MASYEYRCACGERKTFGGDLQASAAGWTLTQVRADSRLKYVVRCRACRPKFVDAILAEADADRSKAKGAGER